MQGNKEPGFIPLVVNTLAKYFFLVLQVPSFTVGRRAAFLLPILQH